MVGNAFAMISTRYKQNPSVPRSFFKVGETFNAKHCKPMQKKWHHVSRLLSHERSLCETVKNCAKKSCFNYKSAALDQLSYADAAPYQSRF
jgi:hypothetical protein